MSRLIDKLNLVSKVVPEPMGFRTIHPVAPRPQMLLIASLMQTKNLDNLTDYAAVADAVLLPVAKTGSGTKALQKIARSLPDIPWGVWLQDISEKEWKTLAKAGCDFVVFPIDSSALVNDPDDEMGKILQVESSLSDGLLKAVNGLPVDAVLTTNGLERNSLTWHRLMLFQHFANLLTKHLLVFAPPDMTANELKSLWEIGVDCVVVETAIEQPLKRLEELHQAIGDLTSLPPRKRKKTEALLPHIGVETDMATDIDTEEEEDDE
ncbi:hypothetical protein ACFLUO_00705 [Chloroflexota bacterium]